MIKNNYENPDKKRIIAWCAYCKDPVYEYENFEYDKHENKYYHFFCYEQMNLFMDLI